MNKETNQKTFKNLTQEQIWNEIAFPWEKFRKKQPIKEAIKFLKKQKGKILDIGCGSGRHFIKGKTIYGVDSSEKMLKLAENKAKKLKIKLNLKKTSADNLPFEDSFFDSALFIATLHCINDEKKREKALKELYRVLKSGGEAIISVWSREHERVKNKPKEAFIPWTINRKKYLRYYYLYDKKELENLLKKTGFRITKIWENKNIFVIVKK